MSEKTKKSNSGESSDRIVIKKYANRRLYNTSTSKYIVLTDVVDLINAGADFAIQDAKSGEDITRTILNQIIFEQETQLTDFLFPLEFQKQLIRMYGDTYGKMFPDFLTQSVSYFNSERNQMQQTFQNMMGHNAGEFFGQAQEMARKNMELFQRSWDVFGMMPNANAAKDTKQETPTSDQSDTSTELSEIQKQIDALQNRLKSLK
ncbi:MAG: polyhydroxyalkanoate synthesis repressor PhaR [Rhodobacteraceae bacterium]|nr:MAG: polyhydroxyalkanoate synthesis repressor PhaR [Paracoccaceae bacterium]